MQRFQMMLDAELDAELERRARVDGVSKAELLRRFARERLTDLPALQDDPLSALVGADADPDDDGSSIDVDDIVYPARSEP